MRDKVAIVVLSSLSLLFQQVSVAQNRAVNGGVEVPVHGAVTKVDSVRQTSVRSPWYSRFNIYSDFSLNHFKGGYRGLTGGMDGSNLMAGFELQELGIGFEVNLNYNILERWGVTAGIGSGYRCFRMVHKANHDSVPIVNPNSTVDTYIRISRFIEIPTYVSYTFFRHLDVGVRASFPILVSYGIRADPDTSFTGFMDWDFPLNMNSTTVEMYLGYHFRIGNLIMTPTFSFGGPVRSVHRRLFTDVGLRINYVSHEK